MHNTTIEATAMPAKAPACSEPTTLSAKPIAATAIATIVWRCNGSPRAKRASSAVANGVAPNISRTLATGARPSARMNATNAPASSMTYIAQCATPLQHKRRQHACDEESRSPERHVPCGQIDATYDYTRCAENGGGAYGHEDTERSGTRPTRLRFHANKP